MTSTIKVNNIQNQCGQNIINENSNTITIGASGDTIALASGASQSGFGRGGSVNWQTTPKTASFTAVSGEGYFINGAGGAVTVTLPASPSATNIVSVSDYNGSASTNSITIARNGSNINGTAGNFTISRPNSAITFVYVDATSGWQSVSTASTEDTSNTFVAATGGTIATSGDFKTHIFTGPGTFTVTNGGTGAGSNSVEYFVVAGGGGGGTRAAAGAGGGGFRLYSTAPGSNSPLNHPSNAIPVVAQGYPITVGAGGTVNGPTNAEIPGCAGSPSTFSTITSAGGGAGKGGCTPYVPCAPKANGGSGGGGGPGPSPALNAAGTGNSPPVSPPQGNNGGANPGGTLYNGAGGGGAGAVGQNAQPSAPAAGGDGSYIADAFIGPTAPSYGEGGPVSSTRYFAGGGGGGSWPGPNPAAGGAGGVGGGGNGRPGQGNPAPANSPRNGTANTGGGGGGEGGGDAQLGGTGGSGIVMIRYKFQ